MRYIESIKKMIDWVKQKTDFASAKSVFQDF
jgi:hypothetical protein